MRSQIFFIKFWEIQYCLRHHFMSTYHFSTNFNVSPSVSRKIYSLLQFIVHFYTFLMFAYSQLCGGETMLAPHNNSSNNNLELSLFCSFPSRLSFLKKLWNIWQYFHKTCCVSYRLRFWVTFIIVKKIYCQNILCHTDERCLCAGE